MCPADATAGSEPASTPKAYVRTLVLAALLGLPVAFAAVLFETVVEHVTTLVWDDLPDSVGWAAPPWWFVLLVTGLAAHWLSPSERRPTGR